MKLGFFTMPIHPLGKNWRQSLREDREAFILADELGYTEGYVGEHATDQAENITSCVMFICTLIDATKHIKLGTGTINMPNSHPVTIASQIAMLDHLLDGRFIFGISPGGLLSDAEAFGNLDADRRAMFLESINQVLEIWRSEPPYHIKGKFWNISVERQFMPEIGQGYLPKPLQQPHPPIVVTAVTPFSQGITKLSRGGRVELFKQRREQPDAEVTLDSVCDNLVTYGSPNKVIDEILAFRETVGDFGTLLYAGKDWTDRDLGRRSMSLLAEKVLPAVNAAIAKEKTPAQ
jgi:alkanesulfonate monooxygenase SsuD/methylene tetrahydromethanopterin reductase-like flavin-dependent oxidoreductase (luciferase family)